MYVDATFMLNDILIDLNVDVSDSWECDDYVTVIDKPRCIKSNQRNRD